MNLQCVQYFFLGFSFGMCIATTALWRLSRRFNCQTQALQHEYDASLERHKAAVDMMRHRNGIVTGVAGAKLEVGMPVRVGLDGRFYPAYDKCEGHFVPKVPS